MKTKLLTLSIKKTNKQKVLIKFDYKAHHLTASVS